MRYFTKEWVNSCQCIGLHLFLHESKKAEVFSEDYFIRLFNQWIKSSCDVVNDEVISQKNDVLLKNVHYYRTLLPKDIIDSIADIRVFALDKASNSIIKKVKSYSMEQKKLVELTIAEYNKHYNKIEDQLLKLISREFNFHDYTIKGVNNETERFSICLEYEDVKIKLEFSGVDNVLIDGNITDNVWKYDELYIEDDKVILKVLIDNPLLIEEKFSLSEFSIRASYINVIDMT